MSERHQRQRRRGSKRRRHDHSHCRQQLRRRDGRQRRRAGVGGGGPQPGDQRRRGRHSAGEIVFDYVTGSDPAATIQGLLAASYNGGLWNTGQFRSSSATGYCGLGWIDDTVNHKVTVAYALYGDSDLNGTVNGADLNAVLANYNRTGGSGIRATSTTTAR